MSVFSFGGLPVAQATGYAIVNPWLADYRRRFLKECNQGDPGVPSEELQTLRDQIKQLKRERELLQSGKYALHLDDISSAGLQLVVPYEVARSQADAFGAPITYESVAARKRVSMSVRLAPANTLVHVAHIAHENRHCSSTGFPNPWLADYRNKVLRASSPVINPNSELAALKAKVRELQASKDACENLLKVVEGQESALKIKIGLENQEATVQYNQLRAQLVEAINQVRKVNPSDTSVDNENMLNGVVKMLRELETDFDKLARKVDSSTSKAEANKIPLDPQPASPAPPSSPQTAKPPSNRPGKKASKKKKPKKP